MKRLDAEYFLELLILLNSTYSQVSNNNSNSNTNFWYQLIEFMQQTSDNITKSYTKRIISKSGI